jgi:hypothetical protein
MGFPIHILKLYVYVSLNYLFIKTVYVYLLIHQLNTNSIKLIFFSILKYINICFIFIYLLMPQRHKYSTDIDKRCIGIKVKEQCYK